MTRRITHEHLHEHLLAIGKDQEAQSALLAQMKQGQEELMLLLRRTFRKVGKMAGEVERIESEVTEISGSVDSAVALLAKLADLIRNNANDPARLNKIADDLDAKGTALAAAVVANDPDIPPVDPNA